MYDYYDPKSKANVDRCIAESKPVEDLFAKVMERHGFEVRETTVSQNKEGKDYILIDHGCVLASAVRTYTCDVKNMRKNWKGDGCHSLEWIKQGDKPGWSYRNIDLFAFETENSFLLIWSVAVKAEAEKIKKDLKDRGYRMKIDSIRLSSSREYKIFLVQKNNRGNNYYCLIPRSDAIKMSFMEITKEEEQEEEQDKSFSTFF